MANDFLVSVLIPFYNSAEYMHKSLESVLNQTYQNIEIICLDDNSTDNTYEKLLNYQKLHPKIKVYKNKRNRRVSFSRNRLISLSKGKYFIFVDSDDWLKENAIERLVESSNDGTTDIITCKSWVVVGNKKVKIQLPFIAVESIINKTDKFEFVEKNLCLCWMHLFRKEFWKNLNVKFLEDCDFEDFGLMPYIYLNSNSVNFINDRLYYYERRKYSVSHFDSKHVYKIQCLLKQMNHSISLFYNSNQLNNRKVKRSLNGIMLVHIYAIFLIRSRLSLKDKDAVEKIDKEIYEALEKYKLYISYSGVWWKSIAYFYNSLILWFKFQKITTNKKKDLKNLKSFF